MLSHDPDAPIPHQILALISVGDCVLSMLPGDGIPEAPFAGNTIPLTIPDG